MLEFLEDEYEYEDNDRDEVIKLHDLKFETEDSENQESGKKEENLKKNKYYKIDVEKQKELENVFGQVKAYLKLNVNLENYFIGYEKSGKIPGILFDIKKIDENKNIFTLFDEKKLSKEIEIKIPYNILYIEKLDNKDLIFLVFKEKNYELLVYRFMPEQKEENKKYVLSQTIKESIEGYKQRYTNFDDDDDEDEGKDEPIEYNSYYIKCVSGNRFFLVSNYGFKMYALNEKKEYELVLLKTFEKISFIEEINKNKFIFGLNLRTVHGYGFCGNAYTVYNNLLLYKVDLIEYDKRNNKKIDNDINLENLKLKEKKFSIIHQKIYESNFSSPLVSEKTVNFSDYVVLKNKFFIIMVKNTLLIFNLENENFLKKYEIKADNNKYFKVDIKNWNSVGNDEFIMTINNNVILFRLYEENSSEINLNILGYGYFPKLRFEYFNKNKEYNYYEKIIGKDLKKINGQKTMFYSYNDNNNTINIY